MAALPELTDAMVEAAVRLRVPATVKLAVTVAAAKLPLGAWLAVRAMVPAPVMVRVEPAMVAGPLVMA